LLDSLLQEDSLLYSDDLSERYFLKVIENIHK